MRLTTAAVSTPAPSTPRLGERYGYDLPMATAARAVMGQLGNVPADRLTARSRFKRHDQAGFGTSTLPTPGYSTTIAGGGVIGCTGVVPGRTTGGEPGGGMLTSGGGGLIG